MYWNTNSRSARKIPIRYAASKDASTGLNSQPRTTTPDDGSDKPSETPAVNDKIASPTANETNWQDIALRLQADMDNFRQRQMRRANEAVTTERERLLRAILPVADNLSRALTYRDTEAESLRQGIELTQRELMQVLAAEGITRIETCDQPFDPTWHEALATIPADVEAGIIVEEIEAGYKLDEKLLRPARVVVAA